MASNSRRLESLLTSRLGLRDRAFIAVPPTRLSRDNQRPRCSSLPRPPIGHNDYYVVQEYQPVGHRLRLAASP